MQNLGFQCFDIISIFLVTQFVQEADEDALAVQIAAEIEQVDFQLLRTVVADSGVKNQSWPHLGAYRMRRLLRRQIRRLAHNDTGEAGH